MHTAQTGEPVIVSRGVSKSFGDVEVLHDVTLDVARGEVLCIIGPSGSGKSTFLRCINGLAVPTSGELTVLGLDVCRAKRDLVTLRRRVGMVFQQFNLFPHRTVLANVAEGPRHVSGKSKAESHDIARRQLERVGLSQKVDELPVRLSGGQQQRVAIARALAMEPEVMLFDECTSALDPELVGEVLTVMKQLADDGMTMVVVSHEMAFARSVADTVVMFDHGRVVEAGEASAFFRSPKEERTRRFLQRLSWTADDPDADHA
jgi:ABC-type polar amino acid transport system ATPase subunit